MSPGNTPSYSGPDAATLGGNQTTGNVKGGMYFRFEENLYFIKEVTGQKVRAYVTLDTDGKLGNKKEVRTFSCDEVLPWLLSGSEAKYHINRVLHAHFGAIMNLRNNK